MAIEISKLLELLKDEKIPHSFEGNQEDCITGFSSLNDIQDETIIWIGNEGAKAKADEHKGFKLAVVQNGIDIDCDNKIITDESRRAFFTILNHFFAGEPNVPVIGQGTYIGENVTLDDNVRIGHNCVIDGVIHIGEGTVIHNNVTIINSVQIGKNCEIQSGVRIGHDGFAYTEDKAGKKTMIKHHGGTVIQDRVYIGANSTIERGTIENTVIGEGTKIDQLCLIGHNSIIGKDNSFVTGSLLYGSVVTGSNCYFASATVRDQTHIGNNVFVGMNSTVINNIEDNKVVIGTPARIIRNR